MNVMMVLTLVPMNRHAQTTMAATNVIAKVVLVAMVPVVLVSSITSFFH